MYNNSESENANNVALAEEKSPTLTEYLEISQQWVDVINGIIKTKGEAPFPVMDDKSDGNICLSTGTSDWTTQSKAAIQKLVRFLDEYKIESAAQVTMANFSKFTFVPDDKGVTQVLKVYHKEELFDTEFAKQELLNASGAAEFAVRTSDWDKTSQTCRAEKCTKVTSDSEVEKVLANLATRGLTCTDLAWGDNLGRVDRDGDEKYVIFDIKSINKLPEKTDGSPDPATRGCP